MLEIRKEIICSDLYHVFSISGEEERRTLTLTFYGSTNNVYYISNRDTLECPPVSLKFHISDCSREREREKREG